MASQIQFKILARTDFWFRNSMPFDSMVTFGRAPFLFHWSLVVSLFSNVRSFCSDRYFHLSLFSIDLTFGFSNEIDLHFNCYTICDFQKRINSAVENRKCVLTSDWFFSYNYFPLRSTWVSTYDFSFDWYSLNCYNRVKLFIRSIIWSVWFLILFWLFHFRILS